MTTEGELYVVVDPDRCQGHNRCRLLAPTLFETDAYGYAHAVGDGRVLPDNEDEARLAQANCPEFAVTLLSGRPT